MIKGTGAVFIGSGAECEDTSWMSPLRRAPWPGEVVLSEQVPGAPLFSRMSQGAFPRQSTGFDGGFRKGTN